MKIGIKRITANLAPRFWEKKERTAFLKLISEIYESDFAVTLEETSFLKKQQFFLDIDDEELEKMNLDKAIKILRKDKLKEELIYILIAEAVFKDEDYDAYEQEFVDELIRKYNISESKLSSRISDIRDKKIGSVLEEWYKEIENKSL